jgi:hypothetical protein
MRPLAWPLAAVLLCGCVSLPRLHLAATAQPSVAVAPSRPVCPGNLLADLEPEPKLPDGAGFPGPETQAESAAVSLYLTWLHAYAVWARGGWGRAADARAWCSTPR